MAPYKLQTLSKLQDSYIKKSEILYVPASLTWELDEYTPAPDTHTKVCVTKVSYGYLWVKRIFIL